MEREWWPFFLAGSLGLTKRIGVVKIGGPSFDPLDNLHDDVSQGVGQVGSCKVKGRGPLLEPN